MKWNRTLEKGFTLTLSILLLITGILFLQKAYTSITFITTALLLMVFRFVFREKWIGSLYTVYLILLIPFFIVNGVLTGTGLEEPVVWYNNTENLDLRILTIPIEDIFYGFELILLNVFLFQKFTHVLVAPKATYHEIN